jgi:hypothetical protein
MEEEMAEGKTNTAYNNILLAMPTPSLRLRRRRRVAAETVHTPQCSNPLTSVCY